MKSKLWHAKLIMLKNTAYAWRQMVFLLSLFSCERVQEFLAWAGEHLSKQEQDYQLRFSPAFKGLVLAADDQSPDEQGARRFIGWSKQKALAVGTALIIARIEVSKRSVSSSRSQDELRLSRADYRQEPRQSDREGVHDKC